MVRKTPEEEPAYEKVLLGLPRRLLRLVQWETCSEMYGVKKRIWWKRTVVNVCHSPPRPSEQNLTV